MQIRLEENRTPTPGGPIPTKAGVFNPPYVLAEGIEPLLRGAAYKFPRSCGS